MEKLLFISNKFINYILLTSHLQKNIKNSFKNVNKYRNYRL